MYNLQSATVETVTKYVPCVSAIDNEFVINRDCRDSMPAEFVINRDCRAPMPAIPLPVDYARPRRNRLRLQNSRARSQPVASKCDIPELAAKW